MGKKQDVGVSCEETKLFVSSLLDDR